MTPPRVLIAEDEVIVAENVKARLEELGYEVTGIAVSGEEAIRLSAETRPHAVVMDIKLQGDIDGVQAAEAIHARFDIPVIYLTGHADDLTIQRAKITEPYGFVVKPFELRELHSTLETALYRHVMERRLRESEKRYRTLVEHSLQAILVIAGLPPRILFANQRCAEISGYRLSELLSSSPQESFQLVHPDDRPALQARVERLRAGGPAPATGDFRLVHPDGTVRWVEYFASTIEHEGQPAVQLAVVDITERKRSEQELRAAHDELEQRVKARTAELTRANELLEIEISNRWDIEQALHRRVKELRAMNSLGQRVGASLSLDQVVEAALQEIAEIVAPDLVLLYLRQGENLAFRGMYPANVRWHANASQVKRLGQCLCGLAAADGTPTYTRNIGADARCTLAECRRAGMTSFAALPLLKGKDVLGVLGLASFRERDFQEQATLLEALAASVAVGVQNALLHREVASNVVQLEQEVRERRQAEQALRASEERFRTLFQNAPLCLFEVDLSASPPAIAEANAQVERVYGWRAHELAGTPLERLYPPDRVPDLQRLLEAGSTTVLESAQERRDGSTFPARVSAAPRSAADPSRIILAVEDITAEKERRSEEEAIAEERRRIAREIHDGIAQDLASLRIRTKLWHRLLDQDPGQLHAEIESLRALLGEEIREVRRSIFALRPIPLDKLGFFPALRQFIADFGEQHQLVGHLSVAGPEAHLPPALEPVLFRILQEALHNIGKHAAATTFWIDLDLAAADGVHLTIRDGGAGFDPAALDDAVRRGHLGLRQMRERVEELHGALTLRSRPGHGTTLHVVLPAQRP